ncbi:MAG TPA: DMT family transporter [Cyclobacteriaceae bacterium]|nr:DMT family transporter [Cyclobacteriaceae bacterium]
MSKQIHKRYFLYGFILSFLGAVCFSTKAVLVKLAYRETSIDAVSLLALRMVFSLPFFLISAFVSSSRASNVTFTGIQWLKVALIGCLGYYISSLLDFMGLQYISAGIERLILFIYPTMVLLMSSFILKQKVNTIQWFAVGITYVGLLLAFFGEADLNQNDNKNFFFGAVMIFTCAITYAAYIVGSGRLIPLIGSAKFNSYAMSFACFGVLIHFFVSSRHSLGSFSSEVYLYGALMAIIATVVPSYLISEGIKRIGSDNTAIVGSVGPVSTIIQAYYFLGEPFLALQIVGTILVLAGVLIVGRSAKSTRSH